MRHNGKAESHIMKWHIFSQGFMASRFKSKSRLLHSVAIWIFTFHKKIRLCEGDLRPISNQPTGHNQGLFYLKIQIYYIHFPSIFSRNCQIDCFLHTVTAILKSFIYLCQITTPIFQLIWTAVTLCKKQSIWQFLEKIEGKWI